MEFIKRRPAARGRLLSNRRYFLERHRVLLRSTRGWDCRRTRCGEPAWGTRCHPRRDKTPRATPPSPHPCGTPPPPPRAHRCAQVWVRNKSHREAVSRFSPCKIRDRVTLPGRPAGKRCPRCPVLPATYGHVHTYGASATHLLPTPSKGGGRREERCSANPGNGAETPQTHCTEEPPARPRSLACVYFPVDGDRL